MRRLLIAASLTLLALPGVAMAGKPLHATGEEELTKLLDARTVEEPQKCLPSARIGDSVIVEDTAIVFRRGGTLYVNRPLSGASELKRDTILTMRLNGPRICNGDIVDLRDRHTRDWAGFASLGDFVPYTK